MNHKRTQIKLLLIDEGSEDTPVKNLIHDPKIELQGVFSSSSAIHHIQRLNPEVILIHLKSIKTHLILLKEIYEITQIPIVLLGDFKHDALTAEALKLGATDFVKKPTSAHKLHTLKEDLIKKILATGQLTKQTRKVDSWRRKSPVTHWEKQNIHATKAELLIICASTGGPEALQTVISHLPQLPIPTLIIQHMPEGDMTQALATRLGKVSPMPFQIAQNKALLKPAHIYLVPGDYHLEFLKNKRVYLNQKPPQCSVRPSIDVTINSAAKIFDGKILSVILTGMGQDGLNGVKKLKKMGGRCLAEDESTCVVYGMPKVISEWGLADQVVPIQHMAHQIGFQLAHWT